MQPGIVDKHLVARGSTSSLRSCSTATENLELRGSLCSILMDGQGTLLREDLRIGYGVP
jgi:hypothetical protein